MFFDPYGWLTALVLVAVVPLFALRGYRLGGTRSAVMFCGVAVLMVGTGLLLPVPWGLLVGSTAALGLGSVYSAVQTRRSLLAGVRGELEPDHTGIALDSETTEVTQAGLWPVLALRLAAPAPPQRTVALLDATATILATVSSAKGASGRTVVVTSVFPGDRRLVTANRVMLSPKPRVLAQGLPDVPAAGLIEEHRGALDWLARHGHRPVALDAPLVADLLTRDWRRARDRVEALPWSAFVALWWDTVRGRTHCPGRLPDQPDIAERLAAWRASEPAPP
jgi:hypothetical protein